ncbi:hypothetical protein BOTCAL_0983g00040 [Botryotinia calthae]|uniref:Uncharacterized protein n=1 Tax=Botryotinia calthae TaxID=38488 RepID=A0A4Y8CEI6_9HELO|nr:hypothetical protein BOTCAL_0983g00040 [Botryotinia calthae]
MSPFLNLAGCTATRPKALVGLLYQDIEFQLFPPLIKDRPPIVVMKLNFKLIKRKIFVFYEAEDLDIYTLIVPPDINRIRLQWDNKWAERPIF